MAKRILIICYLLLSVVAISFAQNSYNPLSKLRFLNGPTDTITLIVSYSNIKKDIGVVNKSIIATIKKHTGETIKGLSYAIDLKLENYPLLSVVCMDNSMQNILTANAGRNSQLRIKCVVYRFYFYDGICNFFYINKINLLNKPDLVTKIM